MTYKQIFNALNSDNQKQLAKYISQEIKCDKCDKLLNEYGVCSCGMKVAK